MNLRREIDNLKRRQVANPTQALPPAPSFTQSSGSSGSITVAGGIGRLSSGGSDHGGGGGSGVHIAQRTFSEVNYGSSTVATTQQGYPLSLATPPTSQIQTVARISDYDSEWKEAQMLLRMTELSNQQDDFLYHLKQLLISQKTSNSASNKTKRSKTEVSAAHTLDGLITSITAQLKMPHKLVLKNVADTVVDTCNYLITTRTSYQSALNHSSQQQQHKQDENIAISNPSVSVEAAISCVRFLVTIIESLSADDIEKIVSECEVTPLSSHLLSKFDAVAGESGSSQHNSSNSSHMATSVIASLSPPSNTSSSNSYTAKQSTSSSHVNVNSTSLPTVTVDDELMSQINNPFYHTKIRLNKDEHINISNIPSSRPAISGTATASATNTNRPSSLLLSHQLMNDPFLTKLFKLIRQLILYTRWCQNQSTKNNDGGDNNSNVININSLLQLRVEVGRLVNSLFVGASGYRLLYNYNCATYILTVYSNSEISLFSDNCYGQFSEQNDKKNKGKNKGNHGYNTNTTISATKYGTSTTVNSHVSTTTTTAVDVANDMIIEYNDNITSDLILPKIPRLPPLLHLITTSHMFEYESDIKYEPDSNQSAIIVENLQIQSKLMEMLTVLLRDYR